MAFQLGIYDVLSLPRRELLGRMVPLADVKDDGYHTYDLGVHDLTPGMYLHVTMRPEAKNVKEVYVDRFILVREGN